MAERKPYRWLLTSAALASIVVGILVVTVVARPWTTALGPSWSPARIGYCYVYVILVYTIPAVVCTYLFTKNDEWIHPLGGTSAQKPLSVYALTGAAVVAAVYAVGGVLTAVNIDLPALIVSFAAAYFGPVVCFVSIFIGFFIRWAIGGAPWLPAPILGPAVALMDASTWAINAYIFWSIVRRPWRGFLKAASRVLAIPCMIAVWNLGVLLYAFVGNPWPAFVAYTVFSYSTWIPTGMVFIVVGAVAGEALYAARALRRG